MSKKMRVLVEFEPSGQTSEEDILKFIEMSLSDGPGLAPWYGSNGYSNKLLCVPTSINLKIEKVKNDF